MNPLSRIHVSAPEWSWPHIRPCYFAHGVMAPNNRFYDASRAAFELGAGWIYVLEGWFYVRLHGVLHKVSAGQSLLHVSPSTVAMSNPEPVSLLTVGFYGSPTTQVVEWLINRYGSIHRIAWNSPAVTKMMELYRYAGKRKMRSAHAWSVPSYSWLLALWGELEKQKSSTANTPRVLADSKLVGISHPNFKSYAGAMGYDPGYLSKAIKTKWEYESPVKVLRLARLQKAEELLRTSNLSIREIAAKACYSGPNAFSAAFREAYGLPPLRYRHAHRWGEGTKR